MYSLIRPLLFKLSPETAHSFTLNGLNLLYQLKLAQLFFGKPIQSNPCKVMGLDFPNRVGLAAGLDKNGEYIDCLSTLGFGFIEVGTVTPRPQKGNPTPRLFRLPTQRALINRMGFNNHGVNKLLLNLQQTKFKGILGINLGKNFNTSIDHAIDDYFLGLQKVYPFADYVTINISSPNTPGLRQLQQGEQLDLMLNVLKQTQQNLTTQYDKYVPLVIKIAPDLTEAQLEEISKQLLNYQIDGVIATNTTLSRDSVQGLAQADETGGLSGEPLLKQSTLIVKKLHTLLRGKIPIIAVGGIMNAADAQAKLEVGASLVQVYTGLIYQGPFLIKEINQALG